VWTLNGSVPGPELHVTQGDRVQVTLQNELPESTTLHWHGVRVPNAEDGVAGLTQDAVPPGQSYTYEFVATDAGTYWYHSHQQTDRQLTKGLFGALVVEPAGGRVAEDVDDVVLLHGEPGHVRINGEHQTLHLAAQPGQTVRLRLIDAVAPSMDGGPETPVLIGAPARVVALDGHDLNAPQSLGATRLPLGMGQRADVVFTMPPAGSVELRLAELKGQTTAVQNAIATLFPGDQQPSAFVSLGDGPAPDLPDLNALPLFDATQYGAPSSDPLASGPYDVERQIVLGERGGIRDGASQLVHTIDGQASPNVPPLEVTEGQRVHLHIVNTTDEYHPMHLHGHVFSLLATDGQPISGSPVLLDSVLVGPQQTVDVAFVADNPGIWMFHCHVLLHASMGMMMTINYTNVYTPYEMGTRSGNIPE
jgi:FtsP/CotA-like multicopper oxidase with cupredoxin domain